MTPTICLNMIVKNESKIITRLFDSVLPIIDCYCICDTGSTDNTIEIITKYFLEKNIAGKIIQEPFQNFAYNRTFALDSATGMSDYLLLLDADMILQIRNFDKSKLGVFDMYKILQGNDNFKYENVRLLKNDGLSKYIGVTHEYISSKLPDKNVLNSFLSEDELFIFDIGDGGSKSDKFERDIRLLTKGLEEEPENINRYTFYLANSYKCVNDSKKAIEYYKKVLNLDSWWQEKYISCLEIYRAYDKLGEKSKGIYYLIESYKYDQDRVECIYDLIVHYCCEKMNDVAMSFYNLIKKSFEQSNITYTGKLFIESMRYDFYLPYYMIIVSDKIDDRKTGIKMYEIVFKKKPKMFEEWWIKNFIYNLQFFINHISLEIKDNFIKLANDYFKFLSQNGIKLENLCSVEILKKYEDIGINIDCILVKKNIKNKVIDILNTSIDDNEISNILTNIKYYKNILISKNKIIFDNTITSNINNEDIKLFSSSSCLIKNNDNGYFMNIRYVNYYINSNGNYLNCDKNIITINKYVELDNDLKIKNEKLFELKFEDRRYLGIEDVRIFTDIENKHLLFIGTGYHKSNNLGIVSGMYDISKSNLEGNEIITTFNNSSCEKNWVFVDYNNLTHIIYSWFPLKICKINKTNELYLIDVIFMPNIFKRVRGSTCGFKYYNKNLKINELWFVTHIVSYENPRHYYHLIAVFDSSMKLLRYSTPFNFEGEPIEYCLSIIVEDNRVLMNYSTWDRTTRIMIYDKEYIDSILEYKNEK